MERTLTVHITTYMSDNTFTMAIVDNESGLGFQTDRYEITQNRPSREFDEEVINELYSWVKIMQDEMNEEDE